MLAKLALQSAVKMMMMVMVMTYDKVVFALFLHIRSKLQAWSAQWMGGQHGGWPAALWAYSSVRQTEIELCRSLEGRHEDD